jgi:hypothetical protein
MVGVIRSAHSTNAYVKAHNSIVKNAGNSIIAMPIVLDTVIHHVDEYDTYEVSEDTTLPIVSDDEEDGQADKHQESLQSDPQEIPQEIPQERQQTQTIHADLQDFNLDLQLQEEEIDVTNFMSHEQEYYYWHTKLGHLSKTRMQQLAKCGTIPKRTNTPRCSWIYTAITLTYIFTPRLLLKRL